MLISWISDVKCQRSYLFTGQHSNFLITFTKLKLACDSSSCIHVWRFCTSHFNESEPSKNYSGSSSYTGTGSILFLSSKTISVLSNARSSCRSSRRCSFADIYVGSKILDHTALEILGQKSETIRKSKNFNF